ncbi:MAG: hypothetical protein ACYC61_08735 [Isosphaeraceae bacterium]
MKRISRFLTALACAVPILVGAAPSFAQDEPPPVTRIVLHPAGEPTPALKYRLLPGRAELMPGNAAIFYHRAIQMMLEKQSQHLVDRDPASRARKDDMQAHGWAVRELKDIPLDQARAYLERYNIVFPELELGALRIDCDWAFDARTEAFSLNISEIQQMRSLGGLVALKARVAIREGRLDEAAHWIQVGLAMSRHVAHGPIMIQALVGVAETNLVCIALEDLIQAKGMPNLYWALVDLPRPFIEATAMDPERLMLERELPRLRELDGPPWSVEEGRAFSDEIQSKMLALVGWGHPGTGARGNRDWSATATVTALVAQAYPAAKRSLIARGRPKDRVEAMPAVQVVFLDTYLDYQVHRDNVYKWAGLPFPLAYEGMERAMARLGGVQDRLLLRLFCSIITSVPAFAMATARAERRLDAIQCIEAIGLYAAAHKKLPERLEDIKDVFVPFDPMTGRPFEYRLEGGNALLSAPRVPKGALHYSFSLHYSIKLAP